MGLLNIFPYITGIGDSLMSGEHVTDKFDYVDSFDYAWLTYLCRRMNTKCKIYSHGGATAKSWLETYSRKFFEIRETCPCFFINLGSNDYNQGFEIGSLNDKQENNTFMGYYNTIIDLIKETNPYAYIFISSLYNNHDNKNEKGLTIFDYNGAIKEISTKYERCYYLDFVGENQCILGEPDITMNGHYNTIGYYNVSFVFEKLANRIIEENIEDFKKAGLYDSFGAKYEKIKNNF